MVGLASMGSGFSPAARHIYKTAAEVAESAELSVSLFGAKKSAISQLFALANECSTDGWDGGEAMALNPDAVRYAQGVIRSLPDGFPLPEVAPEPDGSVSLDWIRSRHRMFSMSVGPSNKIAYARMNGANRDHGVFSFDGESISQGLLVSIMEVMRDGTTSLRVA